MIGLRFQTAVKHGNMIQRMARLLKLPGFMVLHRSCFIGKSINMRQPLSLLIKRKRLDLFALKNVYVLRKGDRMLRPSRKIMITKADIDMNVMLLQLLKPTTYMDLGFQTAQFLMIDIPGDQEKIRLFVYAHLNQTIESFKGPCPQPFKQFLRQMSLRLKQAVHMQICAVNKCNPIPHIFRSFFPSFLYFNKASQRMHVRF